MQHKYKTIPVEFIKNYFNYYFCNGIITRKSNKAINIHGEDGYRYSLTADGEKYKIPVHELAWCLHHEKWSDKIVIPRDLDYCNIRLSNLLEVDKSTKSVIDWLLTNLRKHLVVQAGSDSFRFKVRFYTLDKKHRYTSFNSQEAACRFVRRVKLKIYKQLDNLGIDVNSKFIYSGE